MENVLCLFVVQNAWGPSYWRVAQNQIGQPQTNPSTAHEFELYLRGGEWQELSVFLRTVFVPKNIGRVISISAVTPLFDNEAANNINSVLKTITGFVSLGANMLNMQALEATTPESEKGGFSNDFWLTVWLNEEKYPEKIHGIRFPVFKDQQLLLAEKGFELGQKVII